MGVFTMHGMVCECVCVLQSMVALWFVVCELG